MKLWITLIMVSGILGCGQVNTIVVDERQTQIPVLKDKPYNHVLQLRISVAKNVNVREFIVTTDGTDDLNDITTAQLYYCSQDSLWIDETRHTQFGETTPPAHKITFSDTLSLDAGTHYFWLSYELTDSANLHHMVDAGCRGIELADGTVISPKQANPDIRQRIGVAVRKHMDDNVHTYRIPGLETTNDGTLLAIYDARRESSRDLQGHIDIGLSRSTDQGNSWEPMRIILDMGEWGDLPQKFNGVSDAGILVDRNSNQIFVTALWMHGVLDTNGHWIEGLTASSNAWEHQWLRKGSQAGFGVKQTTQFLITKSTDDGQTWGEPVNLTHMCKQHDWWLWAPGLGHGITLDDGTLVIPTQGRDANGVSFSNLTYSHDHGLTWQTSKPAFSNTTECMAVQLSDGSIMLNMRDNKNRTDKSDNNGRAIAVTSNLGNTWTEHPTSNGALVESTCMASLHKHVYVENSEKKQLILFSNPNSKTKRHRTTIKVSFDDGNTWPEQYWLLLDAGQNFGYSCLTSIDEQTIGILYEGSQADMTFESIPLCELLGI